MELLENEDEFDNSGEYFCAQFPDYWAKMMEDMQGTDLSLFFPVLTSHSI